MEAAIVVCAAIAVKAAYIDAYLGLEQPTLAYLVLGLLLGAILHLFYTQLGLYEPRAARDSSVRIGKLWGGLLMSFLVLLGILYLLKMAEWFSRGWMLLWFASSAVLLGVMRTALLRYTRALVAGGRLRDRVAIYGSLDLGRQLQSYIGSYCPDIEVVSLYVDDRASPA